MKPLLSCIASCLTASAVAVEPYIQPGDRYVEITLPHLRAFVPAGQAGDLREALARADAIYAAMARAAGYQVVEPLDLLLSDEYDQHNGFSTVIPRPLVQVLLAPAAPHSTIFEGSDPLERTLIHEFAHHLSNDRNSGFRGVLERIFGRVLPFDYASLLLFYLSTPAHVTMPRFWHEGLAQWAETAYADPASAWGGRGRDPLTHMVWRLDAANGALPAVGDWKSSLVRWPFGSEVYVYGIAYFRWLEGHYGVDPWRLVDAQSRRWAFSFNGGSQGILGLNHSTLLARARIDLFQEQREHLAVLRGTPTTPLTRLTPGDTLINAPAWLDNERLLCSFYDPWDRPRLASFDTARGTLRREHADAFAHAALRRIAPDLCIRAETPSAVDAWARSRIELVHQGRIIPLPGERLLMPDGHGDAASGQVVAVQWLPAGRQRLVTTRYRLSDGLLGPRASIDAWQEFPTEGRAWTPAFSPSGDRIAWVETDDSGSRLVVAPLADPTQRSLRWTVRGRILHPVWSADGTTIFCCSDVSGVANAYAVPVDEGEASPVTHTIGGIIACVPSPDGKWLACIDHDHRGPFLAIIANDAAQRPTALPAITCSWPAFGQGAEARNLALGDVPTVGQERPYHGLPRMRPLFWTPTTFAAPDGGYGIAGFAGDPLMTHQVAAAFGIGPGGYEPVGQVAYACATWPLEFGVYAWISERSYNDLLVDTNGNDHTYVEWRSGAEAMVGRGLSGDRRRIFAYAGVGFEALRTSQHGAEAYDTVTIATQAAFEGNDHYLEATLGYGDTRLFPTSYAREQGIDLELTARRSGFGGDLDRTRVLGSGDAVLSVWPRGGHQLLVRGQVGSNHGDSTLQGSFSVGGILGTGLPRGYIEIESVGDHLVAGSIAYRLPLWRPFAGYGSSPWAHRQVVLEVFHDVAQASTDRPLGDGGIYASSGVELHDEWEFYDLRLQPGIGVAFQHDGDEDTVVYLSLGF